MVPVHMDISVNMDGTLTLAEKAVRIPNIHIKQEIGRGANALVFLGENQFLERKVAVKIWMLHPGKYDRRDKFRQGIYEARKVASLEHPNIIKVFDAGDINGLFYMTMEFYEGVTLNKWMASKYRTFPARLKLAQCLIHGVVAKAHQEGILHGDLHLGNILTSVGDPEFWNEFNADLKVIDFGTSYFSERGFSASRHWRVLEASIDHLLHPLKVRPLFYHLRPRECTNHMQMDAWLANYLLNAPNLLWIAYKGTPYNIELFEKPHEQIGYGNSATHAELTPDGLAFLQRPNVRAALPPFDEVAYLYQSYAG